MLANSKAMSENAGNRKGWYFGYSQGTSQAMIALAKYEAQLDNYLERVVLLAPCFGLSGEGQGKKSDGDSEIFKAGYLKNELAKMDIYATGWLTWQADKDKICESLSEDMCNWAKKQATDKANSLTLDDHWL